MISTYTVRVGWDAAPETRQVGLAWSYCVRAPNAKKAAQIALRMAPGPGARVIYVLPAGPEV